eukprot:jgi/Picsp_1/6861/NSC_04198-R1_psbp domain-containing protein chloroplastic-like
MKVISIGCGVSRSCHRINRQTPVLKICGNDRIQASQSSQNDMLILADEHTASHKRRDFLIKSIVVSTSLVAGVQRDAEAKNASTRTAGDFCKPSPNKEGYVIYTPDSRATPSIRAGVIQADPSYYSFELPAGWQEGTILNILSGNFCMPRCDEPWIETLWESKEDGFCQLVVSPLYRLVSKANASLQDLGSPEQVIESVGAFVTGNYLDSVEDVTSMGVEKLSDGRECYLYELYAPYAKTGSHFGAAVTVKGDLVYLFVVGGSDRQWANSEHQLKYILKSFKAA